MMKLKAKKSAGKRRRAPIKSGEEMVARIKSATTENAETDEEEEEEVPAWWKLSVTSFGVFSISISNSKKN